MDAVVEARDVSRSFGTLEAVSHLDLSVRRGEIFGLLGPNGAGKTTTVRMIGATLRPTSGSLRIDGRDTVESPDDVKRVIGYMAQKFSLYGDLTVLENLRFFAALYGLHGAAAEERIARTMSITGVTEMGGRISEKLSGGQKQLLALAVAIVHEPKLLILDEPTAGLDPIHRQQIWDLLYDQATLGRSILVTTHGMDEAERCQHLGFINRGRLLAIGTPRELKGRLDGRLCIGMARDLPRAAAAMRAHPDVAWAHPHQGELRICLRRVDADLASLPPVLDAPPVTTHPALEDVFYDLTHLPHAAASPRAA